MLEAMPLMQSAFDVRQKWAALHRSRKALFATLSLAIAVVVVLGALAAPTVPQSLQITGYSGHLGEWELTAALTKDASGRELSGPLTMTHIGLCSQDGPEQRTGEMQLRMARLMSRIDARLLIDGVECRYSGSLSDAYTGMMVCPDRRPVPLTLWTK